MSLPRPNTNWYIVAINHLLILLLKQTRLFKSALMPKHDLLPPSKTLLVKHRDTHLIVTLSVCHYSLYRNILFSGICLTLCINVCIFAVAYFLFLGRRLSVIE